MSVLLFCRTGPGPLLGTLNQSRFNGIAFDIHLNPIKLIFVPDCVIKGFVLPESFTSACQQLITFASRVTLNRFCDFSISALWAKGGRVRD